MSHADSIDNVGMTGRLKHGGMVEMWEVVPVRATHTCQLLVSKLYSYQQPEWLASDGSGRLSRFHKGPRIPERVMAMSASNLM